MISRPLNFCNRIWHGATSIGAKEIEAFGIPGKKLHKLQSAVTGTTIVIILLVLPLLMAYMMYGILAAGALGDKIGGLLIIGGGWFLLIRYVLSFSRK
jgi:Zn-dependent protease with chaperone function